MTRKKKRTRNKHKKHGRGVKFSPQAAPVEQFSRVWPLNASSPYYREAFREMIENRGRGRIKVPRIIGVGHATCQLETQRARLERSRSTWEYLKSLTNLGI